MKKKILSIFLTALVGITLPLNIYGSLPETSSIPPDSSVSASLEESSVSAFEPAISSAAGSTLEDSSDTEPTQEYAPEQTGLPEPQQEQPIVPETNDSHQTADAELAEEQNKPAETNLELAVFDGMVLLGDEYYTLDNLFKCVAVLEGETQITENFNVSVIDSGGYDVNKAGEYTVSFSAKHKTDESIPELFVDGKFNVVTLEDFALQESDGFLGVLAVAAYSDNFTYYANGAGYVVKGQKCVLHGYRNAQAIPGSAEIMIFSGSAGNMFYRYHIGTNQGYDVPLFCVEPNVQDKDTNGRWKGADGGVYRSISDNNGDTGKFHTHKQGWGR